MTKAAGAAAMVQAALDAFGPVSILVNNIGRVAVGTVVDTSEEDKGALLAMTVDMAYSYGRQGIRVNAIAPGHIATPMVLSMAAPGPHGDAMNKLRAEAGLLVTVGSGWDVGWAAAFLASDEARWITGATLPVESGVLSVTPLAMAQYLRGVAEP